MLTGRCPSCRRRYTPAEPFCQMCPMTPLDSADPPECASVLAVSTVYRAGRSVLLPVPYRVALLVENDPVSHQDGCVLWAPVMSEDAVDIGDRVQLEVRVLGGAAEDLEAVVVSGRPTEQEAAT